MKKLLLLIILFANLYANAQYFQTGQDPASIKWRQINTENFQLIYPDYYENQAQELAQKLEAVYNYGSYSMNYKPKKISVILHTQTVKSNGLVAYAPKRSEFYTTPHQAIYPQDWLEQLAVHEFRHVVQIGKLNHELPKIVKFLLGEQGTALVFGAYVPWWFAEGDAVVSETALGNFGRGRFPSFLVEHRAQVVDNKVYSYDKAYLGSYKDFVPSHYPLGYYLVANSRERYGSLLWEKTVKRVGEKPFSVTPFNKALKLEIGMNKVQLYKSIFDSLAVVWKTEDANFKAAPSRPISKENKTYTSYTHNHWLNNDEIISYKTALNKVPIFVKLTKNGDEEKVFHPGFIFDESIKYSGEWIVWSEQIPDIRWSHSGRSKICMLNSITKKKLSFNTEFKAFAPALSKGLDKVVVVEADFSSNYYLSVYRVGDGKLLHRIQTSDNNYFFSPEWINEKELVSIILTNKGKELARFNIETGEHKMLFENNLGEIKDLHFANKRLYFTSGYSGKNALYSYNFDSDKIQQLYEPRFGAEYPALNNIGEIVLSDYTGNGFNLIKLDEIEEKIIDEVKKETYPLAQTLANQEIGKPDLTATDSEVYTSEKYSKPANIFNIHSWAPIFIDPYQYEFQPGISVMSQNKLGTAETLLGYKWDTSEKTGQVYGRYTYKGWYPVLSFEASRGKRASNYWQITETVSSGEVQSRDTTLERFTWNETELSANIYLPLNFTQGMYFRLLQPEFKYEWTLYSDESVPLENFPDGNYHALSYRLYFHQLMRQSQQDVYSNFGLVLDGSYKHTLDGAKSFGNIKAAQAIVYVPGLMPNHGTKLYAGIQDKEAGEISHFSDIIRFPRGWGKIETNQLYTIGVDYKFPLINPDFSLGGLAYCRRINATLFADYSKLNYNYYEDRNIAGTNSTNISSYGVELMGHLNFLRFYAPIKIGVRSSYLPEIEDFTFDFLFSIDFNSL